MPVQWGEVINGVIQQGPAIIQAGQQLGAPNLQRCPGQPDDDEVAAMLAGLNPAQRSRLDAGYRSANSSAPPTDPFSYAKAAFGGSDCQAKSANGQAFKVTFLELIGPYRRGSTGGAVPAGPVTVTAQPPLTTWEQIRKAAEDAARAAVGAAANIGRGAVEGAASGANAAAQGAQAGSSVGAFSMSSGFAIGAAAVIVVLVFLLVRKK